MNDNWFFSSNNFQSLFPFFLVLFKLLFHQMIASALCPMNPRGSLLFFLCAATGSLPRLTITDLHVF